MIINEALINLQVKHETKEAVIQELAQMAYDEGRVEDIAAYVKAVLKRESEYSTAVGFGVAIPHGKTNAVKEPFLVFAKVQRVDWDSLDNEPVDLVFMIGVPEESAGSLHLKILASISRKLMKEEFREGLRQSKSPEEIMELLKNSDLGL
ncbi:MAG: PTS mannose transporter subunit IIAB [Firmicutes bacterium HGW-Firmicutes-1]|jgi:fructose-specific phosphotransferase system IIA component|nr:MAG: PTS mannose transporter subunit IIAB [Firmicutes bacterium HGW-Firmicutes-1]